MSRDDYSDRVRTGEVSRKTPLKWRQIIGVIVVLAIAWLGYFAWQRDRALIEQGAEIGLSAEEALELQTSDARALAKDLGVSAALRDIVREEEGQILTVYRDLTGLPTVGAGHLVLPEDRLSVGDRITPEQMDAFLLSDLNKAAAAVRELLGDTPVSQHEFDALVDLVYNVGPGNVSARKSPALNAAIRTQDYEAIAENLVYSKAADGQRAGGLVNRSERRRRMFAQGDYDDPR